MLTSWDIIIYRITRKLQRCLEKSFSISFFSWEQWGGFCSRELSIIENNISTSYFSNGKSLTILRIEIWQGQGPQGVRGPLLRFHTFFSAHTTDNTLKSSWTWWKNCWSMMLRSISGLSPGGIAIPSSFYGWIFPPEYRLLSKKVQGVFLSKIAVYWCRCPDMPWCPKMPAFCAKIVLLLSEWV